MVKTLLIIVPSRKRPDNAHRLLDQLRVTTSFIAPAYVKFAVDEDDPTFDQYPEKNRVQVEGGNMVAALNEIAESEASAHDYLAFLGDDTFPHDGWYPKIMNALMYQKNSIVYGNDLIHGEGLPTSVFMDSNIVKTLGYMAPPNQKQLFVDNYWKALGEALGTLTYVPEAIIEHLHPIAHKAPSDASYEAAYTPVRWKSDEEAFQLHMRDIFPQDLEKLR
jgi:hypothetical protein